MVIYNPEILVMGIVHGMCGVLWMGLHGTNMMIVVPDMKKANKLADAPILRYLSRMSIYGMVFGFATLITGIAFMFVKWGFNFGVYSSDPEARTVVAALVLVLAVLSVGMAVLRPKGMSLGKRAGELKPMDELPADFKADLQTVSKWLHITGGLVFVAFILMIVAINGGL
jgi:hypothetical protein